MGLQTAGPHQTQDYLEGKCILDSRCSARNLGSLHMEVTLAGNRGVTELYEREILPIL